MTVSAQQAGLRDALARARSIARLYTGKQVSSTAAIVVARDQLDQVELKLANARLVIANGNGRKAS